MPQMSPEFQAKQFSFYQPPAQITGTVEPIDADARELKPSPPPTPRRNSTRTAFAVIWAVLLAGLFTGAGIELVRSGDSIGYAGFITSVMLGAAVVWMLMDP